MFQRLPKKPPKNNKTDGAPRSTRHIFQNIKMGSMLFKHHQKGRFPPEGHRLIANDENPWIDEGLIGCKVTRDVTSFSSSDTNAAEQQCHKKFFVGSLAVTDQRIVAYATTKRLLIVSFEEPRILQITFCVENKTDLVITFDASSIRCSSNCPPRRALLEYRFKTVNAEQIHSQIQSRIWDVHSKSCRRSMKRYSFNKKIAFNFANHSPEDDIVHKEFIEGDIEEDKRRYRRR